MREIFLDITNEYIRQSSLFGGVQGAGNVTAVILSFDETWDGFAKTLTWLNGWGENPVKQVLGVDKLQEGKSNVYRVTIPAEALEKWGKCSLIIEGYKDSARAKSITAEFEVSPSLDTSDADQPVDPTPTVAEQLQAEIEDIRHTIYKAEESAQTAELAAEQAKGYTHNPPRPADGVWYLWDGEKYIKSNQPSKGDKGDTGEQGSQGIQGEKGDDGYSPVRGVDYWTDDDIAEIKSYVDGAILGGAW